MSKLSIAGLFDAVQPPMPGVLAPRAARPASATPGPEERPRPTGAEEPSLAPLISAADLATVVRRAFDIELDRVVSDLPALAEFAGRRLRFDFDHPRATDDDPRAARGREEPRHARRRVAVGQSLSTAMGMARARDRLEARNWVVLVLDGHLGDVPLAEGVLASLARLRRVLIVWCEVEQPPSVGETGPSRLLEQFLAEPGLTHVGPVGGVDLEGVVAVVQALKALDQSALLRLRMRAAAPRAEPPKAVPPPPANPLGRRHGNGDVVGNGRRQPPGNPPTSAPCAECAGPSDRGASARGESSDADLRDAVAAAVRGIAELATADSRIVAVNLSCDRELVAWERARPKWFLRPPGGDAHAVSWCAGLAVGDCRPLVFLDHEAMTRSWNQLREEVCANELPLTLIVPARTTDSRRPVVSDARRPREGRWAPLPGAAVMAPSTAGELNAMLRFAAGLGRPALIALPDQLPGQAAEPIFPPLTLGQSRLVLSGDDVALLGWGSTLEAAKSVAFELARRGVRAAVIDLRFIEPLDRRMILETGRRVRGLVLLEDESLRLDVSGRLLRLLARDPRTAPVAQCTLRRTGRRRGYDRMITEIVNRCLRFRGRAPARGRASVRFDARASLSEKSFHALRPLPSPEAERAAVSRLELSPDVRRWVETYAEVGKRDSYLWKWARLGADLTTLPCVRAELRADVCDSKVLSIMLCVLLDDVADEHGKSRLLDCLFSVLADGSATDLSALSAGERRYAEVTRRLTDEYEARIARYPRHARYAELLRYDAAQFVNTLRYSHLLNRNIHLLNLAEHDLYLPHNMHMMSFATLDLMCSRDFPDHELGRLREAVWHAQCMGRIGNLLSTWRREIKRRDFTSGVFARAVMQGDVTIEQLAGGDPRHIEGAIDGGGHEQYFVGRWQHHRDCLERAAARIEAVDLRELLDAHDRFLQMHLGSRGLI